MSHFSFIHCDWNIHDSMILYIHLGGLDAGPSRNNMKLACPFPVFVKLALEGHPTAYYSESGQLVEFE